MKTFNLVGAAREEADDSLQKRSKAVSTDVLWEALTVCRMSLLPLHCVENVVLPTLVGAEGVAGAMARHGRRTVRASFNSDGNNERDAAELDGEIAEGGIEEVLPSETEQSRRA
eukprot:355935-Chlamydomonas_euryale.AAC.7